MISCCTGVSDDGFILCLNVEAFATESVHLNNRDGDVVPFASDREAEFETDLQYVR